MIRIPLLVVCLISRVYSNSPSSNTQQQCTVNLPLQINPVDNNTRMENLEKKIEKLEEKLDHILAIVNNSADHHSAEYQSSPLLHSCDEVKSTWPDSVSDYYLIADSTGHARHVYCSMDNTCGDAKGGWMRVGYLNMSDPSEQCPPGFRLYEENGIRSCGRQSSELRSVKFPSYSISYSQVCGRVTAHQKGSPDGIETTIEQVGNPRTIDQAYVDGVSITRGVGRKHIWTFIASLQENVFASDGRHECPCAPNSPLTTQSFVGNDYFCESGNPSNWNKEKFYKDDLLWDGKQCGLVEKACCLAPGIPWFNKALPQPTTDYIELRVCGDDDIDDEDTPVNYYEIYVK